MFCFLLFCFVVFFWGGGVFVNFMQKLPSTKFCGVLIILYGVLAKVTKFWIRLKWHHFTTGFCLHNFVSFIKKVPSIKSYCVYDHFSRSYEVIMLWMIKRFLNVNDVIPANENIYYANWAYIWNFWSRSFYFMIKNHFKIKLLLPPQYLFIVNVPFLHPVEPSGFFLWFLDV